jgi:hypothetical protein
MHECQRAPPHVRNDPFRDALVVQSESNSASHRAVDADESGRRVDNARTRRFHIPADPLITQLARSN